MYDLPFLLACYLSCVDFGVISFTILAKSDLVRRFWSWAACIYQTLCLSFQSCTSEPLVGFAIINYRTSSNKRPDAYLNIFAKRRNAY